VDYKRILRDLFKAYYDARKNKRKSRGVISFEMDYERKLFDLGRELMAGTYKISPSICFISFKPLQREIFAADFRDRIIHHLIYNYIGPIFERSFINDSYSCRLNRGTSYGIKRLDHFIRSCSENYKKDCYILKLDIKGYFMSINKNILYQKVAEKIKSYQGDYFFDLEWLLGIIRQVIFHESTKDCLIRGKKEDWDGLPKSKSLFCAKANIGLPIGNLTSQLFGNVYLDDFDHFIKYKLHCKYYGRYVDDMVIVHKDKEYLKSIVPLIRMYLQEELSLELHPKKISLQHFSRGVSFLGAIIKPYRLYIHHKTKGSFYKKIQFWNKFLKERPREFSEGYQGKFVASINSYLGLLGCFNTYKLRKKVLTQNLYLNFSKYILVAEDYRKVNGGKNKK
jgi:RNA-directed DNA polymerase